MNHVRSDRTTTRTARDGPALHAGVAWCEMCGQQLMLTATKERYCAACRSLQAVSKADPRMVRVLYEHPLLDGWGRWQISETRTAYVLTAARWFKCLLTVVDKETLELKSMAVGNRFFRAWSVVEPSRYDFELRA